MKNEAIMTPKQIRKVIEQEIRWHKKHLRETKDIVEVAKSWRCGFIAGMKQIKQLFDEKNFMIGMPSEEFEKLGKRIADLPDGERKDL